MVGQGYLEDHTVYLSDILFDLMQRADGLADLA